MIFKDYRLPQAKKLITTIMSKTDLEFSNAMITRDNTLVIVCRETVIYSVQLKDLEPGFDFAFYCGDLKDESLAEDECHIVDKMFFNNVSYVYAQYFGLEHNPNRLLAKEIDLRSNEEFEKLASMKSADGAKFFRVNGNELGKSFMVPIFSGFPNLNKADQMGLSIHKIDDKYFMVSFNIYKKKINREVKMYFRTLNLGGY